VIIKNRIVFYILFALNATIAISPLQESLGGAFAVGRSGVEGMGANPASIAGNPRHGLSAHATKYWFGLEDENLIDSRIAFVPATFTWGAVGLEMDFFSASVQNRLDLSMAYSKDFSIRGGGMIALGASLRFVRNQYNTSSFYRFEEDPLFNRFGDSSDGFGLDAGALFRTNRLALGVSAKNIVEPSLAISSEGAEGEVDSRALALAGSYTLFDILSPVLQVGLDSEGEIGFSGGLELELFDGALAFRGGYREEGVTFGLGLSGRTKLPIRFDYAMIYPTSNMAKAGLSTHSVGLTLDIIPSRKETDNSPESLPQRPLFADMAVFNHDKNPSLIEPGHESDFKAFIANIGGVPADSTYASVFILGADSVMIDLPFRIPPLEPNERFAIKWLWTPEKPGQYEFLVSTDDDGSRFPIRNGTITEVDISNNRLKIPVYVLGPIVSQVAIEFDRFRIPQMTYIADEEPLVPVIFFEKDGFELSERFAPTLETIAGRLIDNPDVQLVLRGFVDTSGEDSAWFERGIHISRANAVKQRIEEITGIAGIARAESAGYDPTVPRIRPLGRGGSLEDLVWAQQENRRVEMLTVVKGWEGKFLVTDLQSPKPTVEDSLRLIAPEIRNLIERNPEVSIVFEGSVKNEAQWKTAHDLLSEYRDIFIAASGMELNYELMPISIKIDEASESELYLYITGEGLIYRPREAALAAKDFEIPRDRKENRITISVGEGKVESYKISILDQFSNEIRMIETGRGAPPQQAKWDWRDNNGNLVDPRKTYRVELSLKDPADRIWKSLSQEIVIEIANKEIRRESTIIVQFAFDEVTSTSKFLESRIESMAQKIIALAGKPDVKVAVKILGHTDPIGTDRRNAILSQERAREEESAIRRFLRKNLGLANDTALERWLADNQITLVCQGLADAQPYEVERYRGGKFERVLLGNNAFPEGRAANRRVIIQIEEIRNSVE